MLSNVPAFICSALSLVRAPFDFSLSPSACAVRVTNKNIMSSSPFVTRAWYVSAPSAVISNFASAPASAGTFPAPSSTVPGALPCSTVSGAAPSSTVAGATSCSTAGAAAVCSTGAAATAPGFTLGEPLEDNSVRGAFSTTSAMGDVSAFFFCAFASFASSLNPIAPITVSKIPLSSSMFVNLPDGRKFSRCINTDEGQASEAAALQWPGEAAWTPMQSVQATASATHGWRESIALIVNKLDLE
mmetsp:Transcript_39140/g.68863  ORF Transcript_39140/g.68863 Transcript_39140/m.68863 type:complete len:244 (-) Transcript_39140:39-770(-)